VPFAKPAAAQALAQAHSLNNDQAATPTCLPPRCRCLTLPGEDVVDLCTRLAPALPDVFLSNKRSIR
jgi:hypothetical protein